jgi:hypothetical protein
VPIDFRFAERPNETCHQATKISLPARRKAAFQAPNPDREVGNLMRNKRRRSVPRTEDGLESSIRNLLSATL